MSAPATCMVHYEVSANVIGHCQRVLDHQEEHGPAYRAPHVTQMIARPSYCSLLLTALKNGETKGRATGFLVAYAGVPYLVTNRHVVLGKEQTFPDVLSIHHNAEGQLGRYEDRVESLYDTAGNPLWYEHPTLPSVDLAVLPLTRLNGIEIHGYDPWNPGPGVVLEASEPLNIIGFPFGLTAGASFGIWVRGFVASEPTQDWRDAPCFLIDSRTRQGQSGSPVIFYSATGSFTTYGGSVSYGTGVPTEEFVGVYSGRIDNAESDLGVVWKARALRDVIEGQRRANRHPGFR